MHSLVLYIWNKLEKRIPAFRINDIILDTVAFIKEKIEDYGEYDVKGLGKIKIVSGNSGYSKFKLEMEKSFTDLLAAKHGRNKRLTEEGE